MCYHVESEMSREVKYWRKQGLPSVSGVAVHDKDGDFIGSWLCFADNPQSIADAVHVLMAWHPEAVHLDLSYVNYWRYTHALAEVSKATLPAPQADVIKGVRDEDSLQEARAVVKRWLDGARAAAYERA